MSGGANEREPFWCPLVFHAPLFSLIYISSADYWLYVIRLNRTPFFGAPREISDSGKNIIKKGSDCFLCALFLYSASIVINSNWTKKLFYCSSFFSCSLFSFGFLLAPLGRADPSQFSESLRAAAPRISITTGGRLIPWLFLHEQIANNINGGSFLPEGSREAKNNLLHLQSLLAQKYGLAGRYVSNFFNQLAKLIQYL